MGSGAHPEIFWKVRNGFHDDGIRYSLSTFQLVGFESGAGHMAPDDQSCRSNPNGYDHLFCGGKNPGLPRTKIRLGHFQTIFKKN